MKRNLIKLFANIAGVIALGFMFASFSPSLDGRAVVAEDGELLKGLFAKTVGYLPGDTLTVTNISGNSTVEIIVIGALDPSEGVAIKLSPEAAEALGIERGSNCIVKITKRTSIDERGQGSAVIAPSGEAVDEDVVPPEEEEAEPEQNMLADEADDFNDSFESEEESGDDAELPSEEENFPVEDEDAFAGDDTDSEFTEEPDEDEDYGEDFTEDEESAFEEDDYSDEEPFEDDETDDEAFDEESGELDEAIGEEDFDEEPFEDDGLDTAYTVSDEMEFEDFADEEEAEPADEEPYEDDGDFYDNTEPLSENYPDEEDDLAAEQLEADELDNVETEIEYEDDSEEEDFVEESAEESFEAEEDLEEVLENASTESESVEDVQDYTEEYSEEGDEYDAIVLVPVETYSPFVDQPEYTEPEPTVEEKEPEPVIEQPALEKGFEKYLVSSLKDLKSGYYYVQIGVYREEANINEIVSKYGKNYPLTIVPMASGTGYQVMVGSLTVDEYGAVLARFKSFGYKDAFLRKIK